MSPGKKNTGGGNEVNVEGEAIINKSNSRQVQEGWQEGKRWNSLMSLYRLQGTTHHEAHEEHEE